jgi:endonuclease/exonuclease/phosphatase (EEP) superfamily protein YafD
MKCAPDAFVLLEWNGVNFDTERIEPNGYQAAVNAPMPCLPGNPKNGANGIGIFVRSTFSCLGCVVPSPVNGPYPMPLGTARFRHRERNIVIIGLHTPAPISEWTTKPTIRAVFEHIDEGKLKDGFGAGEKGDEVILVGDFNVPSFDPILRAAKKIGLTDAYSQCNRKPGLTWGPFRWGPRLLRLDFIFCSKEFRVLRSWLMKTPGSDHRAVLADIKWADEG